MAPRSCAPLMEIVPVAPDASGDVLSFGSDTENACSKTTLPRRESATATRASASSHSRAMRLDIVQQESVGGRAEDIAGEAGAEVAHVSPKYYAGHGGS